MSAPRRIVFLVYDGVQSLDLTGPWEVLAAADERAEPPYELLTAAVGGGPVRSSSGLGLEVDADTSEIERLDTLIVAGGSGSREVVAQAAVCDEVARLAGAARRVSSVCSGAFLLAQAGLLDGRRATTHWAYCELLARLYPAVEVEPDPIFVRDGGVITSAGVTAGIDLALALVEEDHGPALALEIARWLVVYARRPGGQAQFSVQLAHPAASTPAIVELQGWIAENLDQDLSVSALAGRVNLSERHFSRSFRRELGSSPANYVEQARLERAREMIERGGTGLDTVARSCGFSSAELMRRAFQRRLGTSPREYRDRFQLAHA
jgi:transcriptional regulator GlxA family with amidase domain